MVEVTNNRKFNLDLFAVIKLSELTRDYKLFTQPYNINKTNTSANNFTKP